MPTNEKHVDTNGNCPWEFATHGLILMQNHSFPFVGRRTYGELMVRSIDVILPFALGNYVGCQYVSVESIRLDRHCSSRQGNRERSGNIAFSTHFRWTWAQINGGLQTSSGASHFKLCVLLNKSSIIKAALNFKKSQRTHIYSPGRTYKSQYSSGSIQMDLLIIVVSLFVTNHVMCQNYMS